MHNILFGESVRLGKLNFCSHFEKSKEKEKMELFVAYSGKAIAVLVLVTTGVGSEHIEL